MPDTISELKSITSDIYNINQENNKIQGILQEFIFFINSIIKDKEKYIILIIFHRFRGRDLPSELESINKEIAALNNNSLTPLIKNLNEIEIILKDGYNSESVVSKKRNVEDNIMRLEYEERLELVSAELMKKELESNDYDINVIKNELERLNTRKYEISAKVY